MKELSRARTNRDPRSALFSHVAAPRCARIQSPERGARVGLPCPGAHPDGRRRGAARSVRCLHGEGRPGPVAPLAAGRTGWAHR